MPAAGTFDLWGRSICLLLSAWPLSGPALARDDAAAASLRTTAEWLVDLGRDEALSRQVRGSDDDGWIILSFLQAASRIDPNHADAYLWQYDILRSLGRSADALTALSRYCELRPSDLSARLLWLRLSLEGLQTVEARMAFCREWLRSEDLPPAVRAQFWLHLGMMHLGRKEDSAGQAALSEALAADPDNLAARRLAEERARPLADPSWPVRRLLASLQANPLQPAAVWSVGRQLDAAGLHEQAVTWYERSLSQSRQMQKDYRADEATLMELAAAYAAAGRLNEALAVGHWAIEADHRAVPPRLLMIHLGRLLGRAELVDEQKAAIREAQEAVAGVVTTARDGLGAAQMALYYSHYDPQPEQARRWADLAMQFAPDLPAAKIASGFAALAEGRYDEAADLLRAAAAGDQLAAIGLARALSASQREEEASSVLQSAASLSARGPYRAEIVSLLSERGVKVPVHPAAAAIGQAVEGFDAGLFDLAASPQAAMEPALTFQSDRLSLTRPWRCTLRLTNRSSRAVHLGDQGLVSPQVLLSIRTAGDRPREFRDYLWLSADLLPVLPPGQSVELVQTIDVGPVRRELFGLAQSVQSIEVTGILDAIRDDQGRWTPAAGGQVLGPAKAVRAAVPAAAEDIDRFVSGLVSEDATIRLESAMNLAALAVEQQRTEAGLTGYSRAVVDDGALVPLLLRRAASDPLPHVRARILDALRWYRLAPDAVGTVASALSDRSWLVRLAAVSVLTEQQGGEFLPVLEGIARSDPDHLLRQLAGAHARRLKALPAGAQRGP